MNRTHAFCFLCLCSTSGDGADSAAQPAAQRQRQADGGAAAAAAGAGPNPAGGAAAAGAPPAPCLRAARDIFAAPTLAPLQAATAAAAAAEQQVQAGCQRFLQSVERHDLAAVPALVEQAADAAESCFKAETAWDSALAAFQRDLRLRFGSHLTVTDCQRKAEPPAGHGGRPALRRRLSAAAGQRRGTSRAEECERAHEQLDFQMKAERLLEGPQPSRLQHAAAHGNPLMYAAVVAVPAPEPPANPLAALMGDDPRYAGLFAIDFGNSLQLPFEAATQLAAQRAMLPPAQRAQHEMRDMLAVRRERAGWRQQVMAWYAEALTKLAGWLAEHEQRVAAAL